MTDLAIMGSPPAFAQPLYVGRPNVGSRERLLQRINDMLDRRYFFPGCHKMQPYKGLFPHAGMLLPQTKGINHRVVALPTGTAVTQEMITQIGAMLRLVHEGARDGELSMNISRMSL